MFIYLYIISFQISHMLRTLTSLILCIWCLVSVLWHIYIYIYIHTHTHIYLYIYLYTCYIYIMYTYLFSILIMLCHVLNLIHMCTCLLIFKWLFPILVYLNKISVLVLFHRYQPCLMCRGIWRRLHRALIISLLHINSSAADLHG